METSSLLSLPFIMPAQAQKHVTHNEAIRSLDSLVQLAVKSASINEPPANPTNGERYIVGETPTGLWGGRINQIAVFVDEVWVFHQPMEGWICWIEDKSEINVFSQSSWQALNETAVTLFGVNTDADMINRLSVKSDAVLFSYDENPLGSGDCRFNLNKLDTNATTSVLFNNNYSARAEIGLVGDDGLSFRVSADGSNFQNSLGLDSASGHACFGETRDFLRDVTVTGSSPMLRISNSTETEAGIEIVDTQATTTQNLQIIYNCGPRIADIRVDGTSVMSMNSSMTTVKTNLTGENVICGEYLYSKSRVFIANNHTGQPDPELSDPTLATNLDHIWNDEISNEWHFCSDTSYKATGNAIVRAAAFTTTSDYRLKEKVSEIDIDDAVRRLESLRPVTFKWSIASGIKSTSTVEGFIAHEVQNVIPSAVQGEKDGLNENDKTPLYQSLDSNQLLPVIVGALQSAVKRIQHLEEELHLIKASIKET